MKPKGPALRKRTQIAKANRLMFLWVAGVSVVLGFAVVGAIFLTQMLLFNERVLAEKDRTIATLKTDNDNVAGLESQVRALDANQALIDSKAKPDDQAIQVILDALPSDANSLALGASLQNKLLSGVSGVNIDSLQVDSVDSTSSSSTQNEIDFRFAVSSKDANALKQILHNLEISIRTIDVISLKIENQGSNRVMSVQARAFYEPARIVQLKDKTVR